MSAISLSISWNCNRRCTFFLSGKWEERLAKDAADVMAAARSLDEKIRIETEVHTRTERDIDSVEVCVYDMVEPDSIHSFLCR